MKPGIITADESSIPAKSFSDASVVEDSKGNGCLSNSSCPDESDGFEVFGESDDLLN